MSFTFAIGFPVFEEVPPSDRSSRTLYLGGDFLLVPSLPFYISTRSNNLEF